MEKHISVTDFKQDIKGYSMHLTGEISRTNHWWCASIHALQISFKTHPHL